nr:protein ATP6V1FNB-like [Vespula vulgaris]
MCDNRCQLFHRENYKKEEFLRMKWFLKNQQKLIDNLGIAKSTIQSKIKSKEKELPKKDEIEPKISKKYMPTWRPPKLDGSVNIDMMKPIEPEIRAILYEKGVESFICSNNYFRKRLQKLPEDRFYFPDCTNWLYGWRLNDYSLPPISKFGAKAVIQAQFYQRTASCLQRDPDWYRNCQTNNPKNFNDLLTY